MKKLAREDQIHWLKQHIKTRMFAALASRQRVRHLQGQYAPGSQEHDALECVFHATWEGQHAAMRWLIEFIGVEHSTQMHAVNASRFENGELLTKSDSAYKELKEIWVGCSMATGHPTTGRHPDISEKRLYHAAVTIHGFLCRTVYRDSGVQL